MQIERNIEIDFKQALLHPDFVFSSPQELRDHPGLSRKQKIRIFRKWVSDAKATATERSEEASMKFGRYSKLNEILHAFSGVISDLNNS